MELPISDDDAHLSDVIEIPRSSPFEDAVDSDLKMSIRKLLACLTPKEEAVIRLRFGIGASKEHTLEEVGAAVGLTRERVRQIEVKALSRLKTPAASRDLCDFLQD